MEGGVAKNVEMNEKGFSATRENGTRYGAKLRDAVIHQASWATPNTMDVLPPRSYEATQKQAMTARKGRNNPANLREQVDPTCVKAYKDAKNWATPRAGATDSTRPNNKGGIPLGDQVKRNWATPQASDGIKPAGPNGQKMLCNSVQDTQQDQTNLNTNGKPLVSLKLNPDWVEQLMGLPIGWTDFDFSEME